MLPMLIPPTLYIKYHIGRILIYSIYLPIFFWLVFLCIIANRSSTKKQVFRNKKTWCSNLQAYIQQHNSTTKRQPHLWRAPQRGYDFSPLFVAPSICWKLCCWAKFTANSHWFSRTHLGKSRGKKGAKLSSRSPGLLSPKRSHFNWWKKAQTHNHRFRMYQTKLGFFCCHEKIPAILMVWKPRARWGFSVCSGHPEVPDVSTAVLTSPCRRKAWTAYQVHSGLAIHQWSNLMGYYCYLAIPPIFMEDHGNLNMTLL